MGRPISKNPAALDGFKIDISHQEMDRIIDELEQIYASQPTTWLPTEAIGMMIANELGYEDTGEFEDALKTSWEDFLAALPHLEVQSREDGSKQFRIKPEPPASERTPTIMTLKVCERQDLWRVCLKSPNSIVSIPEIEFEIGADRKRHIDSIYNHVAAAMFNLDIHLANVSGLSDGDREKISTTVAALGDLLDLKEPWTWIVNDPDGMSEIKPNDGVQVTVPISLSLP